MKKLFKLQIAQIAAMSLFICANVSAQSMEDPKVTFQKVQEQCKDIPMNERVTVSVGKFDNGCSAPADLGDNMSTMLTSALQQVNCFRVLEMLKNNGALTDELDHSKSSDADPNSALKTGKQLSAQVVVLGQLTEFSKQNKGGGGAIPLVGMSLSSQKTKLAFILKVVDPQTREILFSQTINVEGKSGGGLGGRAYIPGLGNVSGNGHNSDPAVADAMQKGIVQATQYLADNKDKMPLPKANTAAGSGNVSIITVRNVDFAKANNLIKTMKGATGVTDVKRTSFSSNVATYSVTHSGSTDDVVTAITADGSLSVEDLSEGKATLLPK